MLNKILCFHAQTTPPENFLPPFLVFHKRRRVIHVVCPHIQQPTTTHDPPFGNGSTDRYRRTREERELRIFRVPPRRVLCHFPQQVDKLLCGSVLFPGLELHCPHVAEDDRIFMILEIDRPFGKLLTFRSIAGSGF